MDCKIILLNILLIIIFYVKYNDAGSPSTEQTFKIGRIGNCPGMNNLSVNVPNIQIIQVDKNSFQLNGYAEYLENITDRTFIGRMSVKRCQDMRNVDRCVTFVEDFHDRDICSALENGFLINNPIMKAVKPPLICPISAGKYYLRYTVEGGGFLPNVVLGAKANFVLMRFVFSYQKRRIMCVDSWTRIGAKRKRNANKNLT